MQADTEPDTEIRRRSPAPVLDAAPPSFGLGDALLSDPSAGRSRTLMRGLSAVVAILVLALVGYETFVAPEEVDVAWAPPAGLSAEDTPPWLRTLCAERTPELCALADRARSPDDCAALRSTLGELEVLERKLSARGALSTRQRWVLTELYGQGHQLCQYTRRGPTPRAN
jgi:hypothetical protein